MCGSGDCVEAEVSFDLVDDRTALGYCVTTATFVLLTATCFLFVSCSGIKRHLLLLLLLYY